MEQQNQPSFFSGLEKSEDIQGKNAVFYDVQKHPENIVRESWVAKNDSDEMTRKETVEYLLKNAKDFKKMLGRYGLPSAETQYVIGESGESEWLEIFAETERINGEDLNKMSAIPENLEGKLDEMYMGIFSHLKDSYLEGESFWSDFHNGQIMYGTKGEETVLSPYIVDVDPFMWDWKGRDFWWYLNFYSKQMKEMEEKTPSKNFAKARGVLKSIMEDKENFPTLENEAS